MRRLLISLLLLMFACGIAFADKPSDPPPKPEDRVMGGRSAFWGSNRPAPDGGAYRWRLLGIGVGLIGITGFVIFRLIKKTDAERVRRQSGHAETPQ